ncbi:hypothetical protein P3342_009531 [Pyrenophora teres f. teres]|uniref:Uncharacterized protein n=1 Tax=Pyrenophora teres f. teres (strain 0-1) TaxID=861557 RepID=E3S2P2_PYRTT|nr:hypothetical protein PTT_16604 [Pyrenophora teres f. teres 0-1]KAK1908680.1 hypothetical protein P3342_009531 [Pyrenophora teres f. teres]
MPSERRSVRSSAVRPSAAASSGTIVVKIGSQGKEYILSSTTLDTYKKLHPPRGKT